MCLGLRAYSAADCYCQEGEEEAWASAHASGDADDPYQNDPTDTTPDEEEETALQQEMMVEAGHARPDSIDWMRDGDERHFYDD